MTRALPWPLEPVSVGADATRFDVPLSNWLLDLHGSVQNPDLVLFMAGNQFRALPDLLDAFRSTPPARAAGVERVFYATTPPGRLIDAMASGALAMGNFVVEVGTSRLWPDAFMAGPREMQRLRDAAQVGDAAGYARNRGTALLVRAGNPLGVDRVSDLLRDDVRVALSSREREGASFSSYAATLEAQGGPGFVEALLAKPCTRSPLFVHHREVPQLIADGFADAAPVYAHLADYLALHMPEVFSLVGLPQEGNAIDVLQIALLHDAPHPVAATAWRDFLLGPGAAAILERHGFDCAAMR